MDRVLRLDPMRLIALVMLFPIPDQFVHVLLSKHSDLFDFDVVLNGKGSSKVDPAPWIQFLRVVHELHAQRIFVQSPLPFQLARRLVPRVDDGMLLGNYAFLRRGSPAISGDATDVCQLGFRG